MGRHMSSKNSKVTRNQRRRPAPQTKVIADAEWYFGDQNKLPPKRVISCLRWEIYREAILSDPSLAKRVKTVRESFSAGGRFLEPAGVRKMRRYWEFYSLCMLPLDVWPAQPFLDQSHEFLSEWKSHCNAVFCEDVEEFHDKIEEQGFTGIRDFQQPLGKYLDRADEIIWELSNQRDIRCSGWMNWPLEVIRGDQFTQVIRREGEDPRSVFQERVHCLPVKCKDTGELKKKFNVVVALSLDFEQPNTVLKLQFDTWLTKVRELGIVPAAIESRGTSRNPHSYRIDTSSADKALSGLGKLRLAKALGGQAKAIRYDWDFRGVGSACDPSNFSKAVAEAKDCVSKLRALIRLIIKDSRTIG